MKIWQKTNNTENSDLQKLVENFTVGEDYLLDQALIPYDVQASIAHAEGLESIGILTKDELNQLINVLKEISELHKAGSFEIKREDEDGHTAIENYLIDKLGDTGKKIHTGRSRNDQVLCAIRLWERDQLDQIFELNKKLAQNFLSFAQKYEFVPMPGFTHTQCAMPMSVGMWAGSLAEMLILNSIELKNFRQIINRSPLGSAAGFGVGFDLPRDEIAKELGFDDCLIISLTSQNTRGKIEADLVSHLVSLSSTLAHFANDLVWWTSSEFGYFQADEALTTGSSIMPQKKNVDPAELLRASHSQMLGYEQQLRTLTLNLISGYHRDLQLSKPSVMKACELSQSMLIMTSALIQHLEPNEDKMRAAFSPEIFAADQANALVKEGMTFRDAYREVGQRLNPTQPPLVRVGVNQSLPEQGELLKTREDALGHKGDLEGFDLDQNLKSKTHLGATGNLRLERLEKMCKEV